MAEDLFFSKIHKKSTTITDCDITSRDIINESIATNNFEIKQKEYDERDFIQHTLLDYTNCNDNETINASKFDDTLHYSKN